MKKDINSAAIKLQCNREGTEADCVLSSLGVNRYEQSEVERQIMKNEGWLRDEQEKGHNKVSFITKDYSPHKVTNDIEKAEEPVVYGDSVEGFVTTKKYKVIEAAKELKEQMNTDHLDFLKTEAEELSKGTRSQRIDKTWKSSSRIAR